MTDPPTHSLEAIEAYLEDRVDHPDPEVRRLTARALLRFRLGVLAHAVRTLDGPAAAPHDGSVSADDEPPIPEPPPTRPGSGARRRFVPAREGWGFERDPFTGAVTSVSVLCGACLRPHVMKPPRFTVSEDGEVTARDEGADFKCTKCDAPIGPLRLASWPFGKFG